MRWCYFINLNLVPQSFLEPQNQPDYELSLVEDPSTFGLYFDRYDGKKFIPNKYLAYLYPWTVSKE